MEFDNGRTLKKERFEIGRQIRKARDAKGWTQEELADRIGVKQPAIAHYEQGLYVPKFKVMVRLAKELGMPLAYFYSDTVPSHVFGVEFLTLCWVRIVHWWHRQRHRRNKSGNRVS